MKTEKYYLTTTDIQKLKSGKSISMITKDNKEVLLIPCRPKNAKVWGYSSYGNRYVGLMNKTQFITNVSTITGDTKGWIRPRFSETYNTDEIAAAEAEPGQIVTIPD